MNICIVSVFNSANQGSYQQLKELGDIYSQYGDVYYLDCGIRDVYKGAFDYFIRCCCKLKFRKAFYELKKRNIFKKRYASLKRITMENVDMIDLFVLGSDEIWNVSRADMRHSFLFGDGLGASVVSYAPSVGNTTADELINSGYTEKHLKNLLSVSVRDSYSREVVVASGYDRAVEITVDPTFLKTKEDYIKQSKSEKKEGYVALYCFQGTLDKSGECSSCFTEFAAQKGMKLISSGVWSEYADNIQSDSEFTFDYYIDADYVIANTFHGTAFAINLNKQFITFSCGKEKIKELLSQFGLEDRDCTGMSKEQIFSTLEREIDYTLVNEKLEQMRNNSLAYISDTVQKASCNKEV